MAVVPHGLRLHNPFNLEKDPNIKWQGLVVDSKEQVFCEFQSDLYGLRAGFINLKTQIQHNFNTITKLIYKYAPPKTATNPNENNTKAYIEAVCKRMGKNPDDILTLFDIKPLGEAIIKQEQGYLPYQDDLINKAIRLAGIYIYDKTSNDVQPSIIDRVRNIFAKLLPGTT